MMILFLHITIALGSIIWATYTFFRPSRNRLLLSYGLVGATIASGTYLVLSTGGHLLQACLSGLVYVAIVTATLTAAQRKFATLNS